MLLGTNILVGPAILWTSTVYIWNANFDRSVDSQRAAAGSLRFCGHTSMVVRHFQADKVGGLFHQSTPSLQGVSDIFCFALLLTWLIWRPLFPEPIFYKMVWLKVLSDHMEPSVLRFTHWKNIDRRLSKTLRIPTENIVDRPTKKEDEDRASNKWRASRSS